MNGKNISVFWRAVQVWTIIIFAEFLHGILRTVFFQPLAGDFRARQIGVFTGILIILTISYFFVGWIRAGNNRQLFLTGVLWLVLTVAFEISLGRLLNLSWERIFEDYDIANGGLMPVGLLFLMFAPLIVMRLRNKFPIRYETDKR